MTIDPNISGRDRCELCDKPVANDAEWETVPEGGRDDLCWGVGANCEPIDWRARCLAAEETVVELRDENERLRDDEWVRENQERTMHEAIERCLAADKRATEVIADLRGENERLTEALKGKPWAWADLHGAAVERSEVAEERLREVTEALRDAVFLEYDSTRTDEQNAELRRRAEKIRVALAGARETAHV